MERIVAITKDRDGVITKGGELRLNVEQSQFR